MRDQTINYFFESFKFLIEKHGFIKFREIDDDQSFLADFLSDAFMIRIEEYRFEFTCTLYKNKNGGGANLFSLLDYLNQSSKNSPKFKSFEEEKNREERFRKQFRYLASVVSDNFDLINSFFSVGDFKANLNDMRKFMINKYPNVFKIKR